MKRGLRRLMLLSMVASQSVWAADAHMTPEERTKVLKWLEESRTEFLGAINGVTDRQWKWKPAPERWSVGECAEHIVLAEALLFDIVQKSISAPPTPDWEEKTKGKGERIEAVMAPRLGKAQAPEPIVPKGDMSLAQVKERFERQRVEIVKFANETTVPLNQYTFDNPFFGTLNAYHWLMYAPLHTMRHDKQIAEVKGTPGYPE